MKKPNSPVSGNLHLTGRSSILSQSSWWVLNKSLTIFLGFDASLLLSDLSSKQDMYRDAGKLDENGFFYNFKKKIQEDTGISEPKQDKAIEILKKHKLIETIKKKGIPPILFYRVNITEVNNLILELHEK